MVGRTGYTATPDEFDPAPQIDAAKAHFDALIGETAANAAALPASGNWLGRTVMALDTNTIYVCTALPGTWLAVREDTGWVNLTLNGAQTVTQTPRVRRINGVVHMEGQTTGQATIVATGALPAAFRPTVDKRFVMADGLSGSSTAPLLVEAAGRIITSASGVIANLNFSWVAA